VFFDAAAFLDAQFLSMRALLFHIGVLFGDHTRRSLFFLESCLFSLSLCCLSVASSLLLS
jgi:hypothetical protein